MTPRVCLRLIGLCLAALVWLVAPRFSAAQGDPATAYLYKYRDESRILYLIAVRPVQGGAVGVVLEEQPVAGVLGLAPIAGEETAAVEVRKALWAASGDAMFLPDAVTAEPTAVVDTLADGAQDVSPPSPGESAAAIWGRFWMRYWAGDYLLTGRGRLSLVNVNALLGSPTTLNRDQATLLGEFLYGPIQPSTEQVTALPDVVAPNGWFYGKPRPTLLLSLQRGLSRPEILSALSALAPTPLPVETPSPVVPTPTETPTFDAAPSGQQPEASVPIWPWFLGALLLGNGLVSLLLWRRSQRPAPDDDAKNARFTVDSAVQTQQTGQIKAIQAQLGPLDQAIDGLRSEAASTQALLKKLTEQLNAPRTVPPPTAALSPTVQADLDRLNAAVETLSTRTDAALRLPDDWKQALGLIQQMLTHVKAEADRAEAERQARFEQELSRLTTLPGRTRRNPDSPDA